MKKILLFLSLTLIALYHHCSAIDHRTDNILRIVNIDQENTSQAKITSLLGNPDKIESGKKRTKWYYTQDNCTLVVVWRGNGTWIEKFIFTNACKDKMTCNMDLQQQLTNGATDIEQTFKLLGIPADMTVKQDTQIMHYNYQGSMARLFFRDNKLVDFALVEQKN